ncbi:hypothetical protein [Clostridium botulinum]|uniref:Tat pathway signal protein n=1 Tax=Clostridium botulinum TaxID=1491 RepID=A0A9Q1UWL7_CLOBO|nr:hypothetical protein [Clostridium botulinum]AEB76291.1 conserved hypothetical protein [Clostridium botulinum BKT015925]KEH99995.1 Tat pathway signal protein [Clostridium botulinum D str. 16868]KEI04259.1 Tat pathway signal protein [Clostridium botulinum C/D str. Sp77]KLU75799.1 Tat pathway signal protein [Clostridium botulinum V891]KOA75007.1 Tat pathway signal protein [Clostridium botulinum]
MLQVMNMNRDHVKGILIGVGVCAVGYYVYKKNQSQVDSFLKKQGINISNSASKNYNNMSLEELMETKELIEDIIAEKEMDEENCCSGDIAPAQA